MGRKRYPKAKRLMITTDGGGNNGYRVRLWKIELQRLADEIKLLISLCPLPPGTSHGSRSEAFEHRPTDAATTTDTGLKVRVEIDT
jgi:hypothetical protein